MEYQKIINLLNNTQNQTPKFRTKIGFLINDELRAMYDEVNQIRFSTSMLSSRLCNYSDACICLKGAATVANTAAVEATGNNVNKKVLFKNCAPCSNVNV